MKTALKNFTTSVILYAILAIILGIAIIAYPGIALETLGIIIAVYLIIHGITLIILDIKALHRNIPFEGFLFGVLCVILGITLFKNPFDISVYIGMVIGLWIIVSSFNYIKLAASLKGTDAPWVLMIILSIIDIIIGVLAIWCPPLASLSLTVWIGIFLVVHGIISIITMLTAKKNTAVMDKMIKEQLKEAAKEA